MIVRIISIKDPRPATNGIPVCTEHNHSKFVLRRKYVEQTLLPQMKSIWPDSRLFDAITPDHITVDGDHFTYADITLLGGRGNIGCLFSHLMLWNLCVRLDVPVV